MLWSRAATSARAAGSELHARCPLLTITVCLVVLCVLLHHEALRLPARILPRIAAAPRVRVVILIFGLLQTGFEALSGLVMVGWSTAFTFLHMQRHWQDE